MRYYPEITVQPGLMNLVPREIDELYLDNTYCHPRHRFPTRAQAAQAVLDIIKRYPQHDIKLGCRALGREELYVLVALTMGELISVSTQLYDTLAVLGVPDVFTTQHTDARIELLPMGMISRANHDKWNTKRPTVSIVHSALLYRHNDDNSAICRCRRPAPTLPPATVKACNGTCNIDYAAPNKSGYYIVPYSDHSDFLELQMMVRLLQPRRVRPIVKEESMDGGVGHWSGSYFEEWLPKKDETRQDISTKRGDGIGIKTKPRSEFEIPSEVSDYMSSGVWLSGSSVLLRSSGRKRRLCAAASGSARKKANIVQKGVIFCDPGS